MLEPLVFSIADACAAGAFKRTRCYELIAQGKLVAKKMGTRTVVTAASLSAYIDGLPAAEIRTGLKRGAADAAGASR